MQIPHKDRKTNQCVCLQTITMSNLPFCACAAELLQICEAMVGVFLVLFVSGGLQLESWSFMVTSPQTPDQSAFSL